ncbi:MAG: 50S ribosomal protein L25 [Chlamydiales bacterium]|nr:50S ribosomal protein L25 [Chlamydiales bacterium]
MKLTANARSCGTGLLLSEIRNNGHIPAVIYSKGKETEVIQILASDLEAILRKIEKGHLATTVFELHFGNKVRKAILKEIQYHRTTYQILHLDFQELQHVEFVSVNVPVHFTSVADCTGIKLGGFLRQLKRYIRVKCPPSKIPSAFYVDVRELGIRQSKRVKDIAFPEGVQPLAGKEELIVAIGK